MKQRLRQWYGQLAGSAVRINGQKVKVPSAFLNYFSLRADNPLEPEISSKLSQWLKPGDTFVDVGANVGWLSLQAARAIGPEGRIFAFEPLTPVFSQLVALLDLHDVHQATTLQVALSDSPGQATFFFNPAEGPFQQQAGLSANSEGLRQVTVLTDTWDRLMPEEVVPALVKIDVEGHELSVLQGMDHMVRRCQPSVLLEVHGNFADQPADLVEPVFQWFADRGYQGTNLHLDTVQTATEFLADSGFPDAALRRQGHGHVLFTPGQP